MAGLASTQFEAAAVGLGEATGEGQAPAVRGAMVARAVEQRGDTIVGNPGPLVLDRDTGVLHEDGDRAATVAQRVLQQHVEDLAGQAGCGQHVLGGPGGHHHLAALLGEALLPVGDLVVDQRGEVELGSFLGAAGPGDGEEFVERGVQIVCLRQRGRGLGRHVAVGRSFEQFEPHRDAGQPGAQLMGGVRGEPALGFQHPVDAVGAQTQRARDRVDLADARRLRSGRAEVAVADS